MASMSAPPAGYPVENRDSSRPDWLPDPNAGNGTTPPTVATVKGTFKSTPDTIPVTLCSLDLPPGCYVLVAQAQCSTSMANGTTKPHTVTITMTTAAGTLSSANYQPSPKGGTTNRSAGGTLTTSAHLNIATQQVVALSGYRIDTDLTLSFSTSQIIATRLGDYVA